MKAWSVVVVAFVLAGSLRAQDTNERAGSAEQVSTVVDVRSLVQKQVEDAVLPKASKSGVIFSEPDAHLVALGIASVVSLLTTTILIVLLHGRKKVQRTAPTAAPASPSSKPVKPVSPVDALLQQAHLILLEKRLSQPSRPAAAASVGDPYLSLAQRFGRGRGEMALAGKLALGGSSYSFEQKIRNLEEPLHGQSPEVVAQRFGVGTGELHLAQGLRVLRDQHQRRGES